MSAAVGGAFEQPGGLDPQRAVQIVVKRGPGPERRGSGYQVAGDMVLTAAHVLADVTSVVVRFLTEDDGTREVFAEPVWSDADTDIALLRLSGDNASGRVPPVRFARITRPPVNCEALGFPRFKLRRDASSPDRDGPTLYRDSHHARGTATSWSDLRTHRLEVDLGDPERDPEPGRSPWEGMSGAVVWSDGCIIGVVSEHHRTDGLGRLTASRVDHWYRRLDPDRIGELGRLIGLPDTADRLESVPRPSPLPAPGPESPPASEHEDPPMPRPLPGGSPKLRKAAEDLAVAVNKQWREEERRRQVRDPYQLPVRFRYDDAIRADHWDNIRRADPQEAELGPLPLAGQIDGIVKIWRSIPSHRLVVLGAPGTGKTILTLRFVLDLLSIRARGDRVPAIFGLSSWDPETTSLNAWMAERLERDYSLTAPAGPGGRSLADALVDGEWILPVLDGFDEIASGLQQKALDQLNADTDRPLLLTSRAEEYLAAVESDVLTAAAVVELENLTLDDLAQYLPRASRPVRGAEKGWGPVLTALGEQPQSPGAVNVAAALSTPLMVAMARTVYRDTSRHDPEELLDTTRFDTHEAVEKHLLAEFIPAAYKHPLPRSASGRRRHPRVDREHAERWLGYLAMHLHRLDERDIAWWQLGTAMRRSSRTLLIGFLAALTLGVTTGIGNIPVDLVKTSRGLGFALERGLAVGLLRGLVAGLGFGTVYWFTSLAGVEPSRVRIQFFGGTTDQLGHRRSRFAARFRIGFLFAVPAAIVWESLDRTVVEWIGLGDGLDGGLAGGLLFPAILGGGAGLALGFVGWLEAPIETKEMGSPAALLRTNRKNVLIHLLAWMLVFQLPATIGITFISGPVFGIQAGLVFGVEAMIGGGLGYGLALTAWGQWVALVRIWLPLTGRLPWAVIAFLDDACERGVLRQAGAVYQFRHAQLQDHLTRSLGRSGDEPVPDRDRAADATDLSF